MPSKNSMNLSTGENYLPLRNFFIKGLSVGRGGIIFLRILFLNEMGANVVSFFTKKNILFNRHLKYSIHIANVVLMPYFWVDHGKTNKVEK